MIRLITENTNIPLYMILISRQTSTVGSEKKLPSHEISANSKLTLGEYEKNRSYERMVVPVTLGL